MIYISKRRTPSDISKVAKEIRKSAEFKKILPGDTKAIRHIFDDYMPKDRIQEELVKEQHALCAYCMSSISSDNMKIEHYVALSDDKNLAIEYGNMLGVCFGGQKSVVDKKKRVLCCDASRKDASLQINPLDRNQMQFIAYRKDGRIYIKDSTGVLTDKQIEKLQQDIDYHLCLNGLIDAEGNFLCDTSTDLVLRRKQIYDRISSKFERWDNEGRLNSAYILEKINKLKDSISSNNIGVELVGVWLYFYTKKYIKLIRAGK